MEPELVLLDESGKPDAEHLSRATKTAETHAPGLLASYATVGGLNNRDLHNMPSKRSVALLCEDLLQLLFPGFHDSDAVGPLEDITHERMRRMVIRLEDQIRKGVRIGNPKKATGKTSPIIQKFCKALPEVRELLHTDIESAYEGDPSAVSREEILLAFPGIEAIAIQRLAHRLFHWDVPLVPRLMTEWAHSLTGIDIHPGAKIGSHFFIDHGTGVVVGETCRIGSHVKLYHGVTLGARSFAKNEDGHIVKGGKRHPDVGDHVTIYPNSTILGGETRIGAHTTIGANVFLMHSVPAHSLVIYEEKQLLILDKAARRQTPTACEWSI